MFDDLYLFTFFAECADTIMDDAKRKKEEWTQRLQKYEEESLLLLRDALLARGSMLTMSSADIKDIIRDIKTTVREVYRTCHKERKRERERG